MATVTINNPNPKPWVNLYIPANTPTNIKLENTGEYLFIFLGNASQSEIFTVLVGSSGNITHTTYGSNTALTITDGSGTGIITLQCSTARNVYVLALNAAEPAKLVS